MKHYRNTHKHTQFRFLKMQPYANTGNKGNSIYWDQYYIDSKIIPGNYTIFEHKYKSPFQTARKLIWRIYRKEIIL